jgi:hypothetical protein
MTGDAVFENDGAMSRLKVGAAFAGDCLERREPYREPRRHQRERTPTSSEPLDETARLPSRTAVWRLCRRRATRVRIADRGWSERAWLSPDRHNDRRRGHDRAIARRARKWPPQVSPEREIARRTRAASRVARQCGMNTHADALELRGTTRLRRIRARIPRPLRQTHFEGGGSQVRRNSRWGNPCARKRMPKTWWRDWQREGIDPLPVQAQ